MKTTSTIAPNRLTAGFVLLLIVCIASCSNPAKDKLQHLARGKQYLKEQLYAEARIEFRSALQLDRQLAAAHYGLGEASLALGDAQEAAEQFQLAAKFDGDHLLARLRLGALLLQVTHADRNEEAVREAERLAGEVLKREPQNSEAVILLADVRFAQKRWDEALAELQRAVQLHPQQVEPKLALARYYERRAAKSKEPAPFALKADEAFRAAIAQHPQAAQAYLAYGDYLYANKRAPEAEQQLQQAFALNPKDKLVLVALRRYYETHFRYDEAERLLKLQIEQEPDKLGGQAQLIDLHARAGRTEQASGEYRQLLKDNPDFLRAYSRLAELLLAQGQNEEAAQQVAAALQRNPQDTDALLVRGRLRTLAGELREAIIDLEQALKLEPALPVALYYTADAYLQNNDAARARALVNTLLSYYPRQPMGLLMLARIHLQQGKAAEAAETAEAIINELAALQRNAAALQAAHLPAEAMTDIECKAYTSRAIARLQLNDAAGAQSDLRRAAEIDPRAAEPPTNLALIYLAQRKLAQAQQSAEHALQLAPNNAAAQTVAVDVYLAQRNHQTAHDKLAALLAASHKRAPLLFQQARVYEAQGEAAQTERLLREIIEREPYYVSAYFALSDFYQRQNKTEQAIAELQRLTANKNSQTAQLAQAFLLLGMLEQERGRVAEAVRNYEQSLNYDARSPAAAIAYNNLAWLFVDKQSGPLDKAIDYCQRAISITPEAGFYDTLGVAYFRKGQFRLAIEQLNRALERRPANAAYQLHLARALRANKEVSKARQAYELTLQLGGADFAEASAAKEELAALPRS